MKCLIIYDKTGLSYHSLSKIKLVGHNYIHSIKLKIVCMQSAIVISKVVKMLASI